MHSTETATGRHLNIFLGFEMKDSTGAVLLTSTIDLPILISLDSSVLMEMSIIPILPSVSAAPLVLSSYKSAVEVPELGTSTTVPIMLLKMSVAH